MLAFYTILMTIAGFLLKGIAPFHKKIRLFVSGRAHVFSLLSEKIRPEDNIIWIHAASLGEFEQGLPVIQQLKSDRPEYRILVTFFSPSGYEVKKNSNAADIMGYLPLDTKKNAEKFLQLAHPEIAVFIKYEFWPNYLEALKKRNIPVFLASGVFRKAQVFFKFYGGFMRKRLGVFEHFFVQDEPSKVLLNTAGFQNVTVSGDTRFDRVSAILKRLNSVPEVEAFLQNELCIVVGSSWPEDEALFVPFINTCGSGIKFIIAPHNVSASSVMQLKKKITRKTVLFSERATKKLTDHVVMIVDTIGLLTKIYSYAAIAYVGGGVGTRGLHNILEPAVFGIPVVIGKNFEKFNEARALVALGGVISVADEKALATEFHRFLHDVHYRATAGTKNAAYVREQRGATEHIVAYLLRWLPVLEGN